MQILVLFVALLFSPSASQAACPKNKKEWQAKGPKLLVEKASRQATKIEIPDFSRSIGKSGKATPFKEHNANFVMVEASDKETSLFLSGVMKCDSLSQEPTLVSLTWVKGDKSGIIKVVAQ